MNCIECGTETTGSIGAAGLKWKFLCQPCKDKADRELAGSLAIQAAMWDKVFPTVFPNDAISPEVVATTPAA